MSRPELTGHAAHFYNEKEARKYDSSSRMIGVQREITERAIELLRLDALGHPALVLDIGCGSGLSGQVLEDKGHVWVGCDVSRDMLTVAKERMTRQSVDAKEERGRDGTMKGSDDDESSEDEEDLTRESAGDLLHHDMGTGLPFRPATFDACISISALQWLCYSNSAQQNPKRRLTQLFSSLYTVLKRGGRAVLPCYPETAKQAVLISETATACGFTGGVLVDYPNSAKAKKHYLVLSFDRSAAQKKGAIEAAQQNQQKQQQQQHVQVASLVPGKTRVSPRLCERRRGSRPRNGFCTRRKRREIGARLSDPTPNTQLVNNRPNFRHNVQHGVRLRSLSVLSG